MLSDINPKRKFLINNYLNPNMGITLKEKFVTLCKINAKLTCRLLLWHIKLAEY
jgi:hypothetical protein